MSDSFFQARDQAIPYPSRPVPLSHPTHLYVVGRLHGLDPVAMDGAPAAPVARVLELGCGAGGNLLPMAASLPGVEFVGVDLSGPQIDLARVAAVTAGINNVEFLAGDALSALDGRGDLSFDYIILHGLYSWVSAAVQDALLPLCSKFLSDNGIIYISYNTYPGWHGRGLIRDLMLRACADLSDPTERATAARGALDRLVAAYAQPDDAYANLLAEEQQRVAALEDGFLLHDLLEAENHPIYVDEFLRRGADAGLQFVSESNVAASREENFAPGVRLHLSAIDDLVQREQNVDFLLNRSFRQSVLCKAGHNVRRQISAEWLSGLYLASPVRPLGQLPEGEPGEAFFATPDGGRFGMTTPSAISALNHLALAWPDFIALEDLAAKVGDPAIVAQLVIDLYPRNWLDLLPLAPGFVMLPGPRPMVTPLARVQIVTGEHVTDLRHRSVLITDSFTRQLIPHLDGQTDRADLLAAVAGFEISGRPQIANDDPEALLDAALHQLAERCLLVQ
ncbi:MAG: methyltransferase domain-containing protein [Rhodospirillaceae bacterium]|jgi:SAM-dependent methyltransferase|nr:methyltransferase domain-containing protein [Rhodospirillaceae bacterium]MBT4042567.1 methyltransferase domain-containing protein [Rhodospirillaceae bacterium]MBT4687185.1 methyltransferase domain-containing protein [Rhodospirillaceae bacterium]MBT5083557.1 methyltransferase domain-containing protein [Rhodospirillaceae bacterium]MBT5525719.1 methyltransferase domain-containing protein [Rhodospirillaceae bacterium]